VHLLVSDADQLSQLLLAQPNHDPALAHASREVAVDILCPGSTHSFLSPHGSSRKYA
jgi:hypothetical protein